MRIYHKIEPDAQVGYQQDCKPSHWIVKKKGIIQIQKYIKEPLKEDTRVAWIHVIFAH